MAKFFADLFDELSLYVRHCAWLNTAPDKEEGDKSKTPEISRREALKKDGITDPEMPDCDAHYLVAYLFEIGPTMPVGMGDGPISHTELRSWQKNVGIRLAPWESRFIKRLSIEYLNQSNLARDRNCKPPWTAAAALVVAATRNPVSLKDSLRELAKL